MHSPDAGVVMLVTHIQDSRALLLRLLLLRGGEGRGGEGKGRTPKNCAPRKIP